MEISLKSIFCIASGLPTIAPKQLRFTAFAAAIKMDCPPFSELSNNYFGYLVQNLVQNFTRTTLTLLCLDTSHQLSLLGSIVSDRPQHFPAELVHTHFFVLHILCSVDYLQSLTPFPFFTKKEVSFLLYFLLLITLLFFNCGSNLHFVLSNHPFDLSMIAVFLPFTYSTTTASSTHRLKLIYSLSFFY